MARHSGHGSQSTTVTRIGPYTRSGPNYSGAKTEHYREPPMKTVKLHGGKSARVVKSPPRGCGSY